MRNVVGVVTVWMTSSQKYVAGILHRNVFEEALAAQERF